MSKIEVEELPDWEFDLDEVSANVYKVIAKHRLGSSIEQTSFDPEKLLADAKAEAHKMQLEIQKKLSNS